MVVNGTNIDFLIAALVIEILTIAAYRAIFTTKTVTNFAFGRICYSTLIAIICDLLYQFCKVMNSDIVNWRGIGRFLFNTSIVLFSLSYYMYSRVVTTNMSFKSVKKIWVDYAVFGLAGLMELISVINYFTHSMEAYYVDGVKTYGYGYAAVFVVPLLITASGCIYQIIHRSKLTRNQLRIAVSTGVIFNFASVIELALNSQYLLTMFGLSAAVMALLFTCETKDYSSLVISNAELEVSKEKAEQANHAKSDFLARMSHEIRTPMNAILGMNEMIVNEAENPRIRNYAIDAYSAGRNLLLIINDILDFSKIESGKMELIEKPFDVKGLVRDEWVMFDIKAKEKKLNLTFDIDRRIPRTLMGDGGRIKQIITNILGNAIKYTMVGTVALNMELLDNDNENATIKVSVTDTGRGIKKEDISKLFEAFERIDEKENSAIEGTGLGVNITAKLLKLMNSELMVDSVEGRGSTFSFILKLLIIDNNEVGYIMQDEMDNKAKDIGTTKKLVASKASILVVDDTAINLKVFSSLLRNTKMAVTVSESGEEAVALAHINHYDVIFMDHLMPGIDGVEALKGIREDKSGLNRNTPVVALTANAIKGADEMYKEYGFDDVTFKPYTQDELYKCLGKHLPQELIENS